MTRRRWIADEVNLAQNTASLTGANARHLATVLRAKVGQQFDITLPGSDGDSVYAGKIISIADDRVTFALSDPTAPQPGQLREVDLLLAVFKFDRMEWVIEKATELGVSHISPLIASRTQKHLAAAAEKRLPRWRRIAHEASQQARLNRVPEVALPQRPEQLLAQGGPGIFLHVVAPASGQPADDQQSLKSVLGSLATGSLRLAVGPEGGWTDSEADLFLARGWKAASLGPNILRAETAAIAAIVLAIS